MASSKNYYQTLQVDPSAEFEVLSAAYKRLSLKYHPDSNRAQDATVRMQELNEAYHVLRDPVLRAQYDLALKQDLTSQRPVGHSGAASASRSNSDSRGGVPGGWAEGEHASAAPGHKMPIQRQNPAAGLANLVASLVFPVTYSLMAVLLFRIIRPYNIIYIAFVLILAGVVAYSASSRVNKILRRGGASRRRE